MVLTGAMIAYLLLALSLFKEDKLTYAYDLNAMLAQTLGEEVELALETAVDKLTNLPAKELATAEPKLNDVARQTFARDEDFLSVELWVRDGADYERSDRWSDAERLAGLNVTEKQLAAAGDKTPVPWAELSTKGLWIANASVEPDVALVRIAAAVPDSNAFVVADIRHERLLRLFGKGKTHRGFLVDAAGQVLVHPEPEKVVSRADLSGDGIVKEAIAAQAQHAVKTATNDAGEEVVGAYSRVFDGRLAVIIQITKREALAAAEDLTKRSIYFGIGILLIALLISVLFSRVITAPIRRLRDAANVVARGFYDVDVDVRSRNELGTLAAAFNEMASELADRDKQLKESLEQLVHSEKLATVGQISASISHEVRNPMAAIRGLAQLGQKHQDPEKTQHYLGLIEKETDRATEILNTLLTFVRREEAERWHIDVSEAVRDACALPAHRLRKERIQLELDLDKRLPAVLANPTQIQQVVLNLMMNAIDAMAGTTLRRLVVRTASLGNRVAIEVSDTGPGIAEEVRGKLFEAFVTSKPRGKGTGLGLHVCKQIVDEHEGQIEVEAPETGGARFRITLPATPWNALHS